MWNAGWLTFLDRRSHDLTIKIAPVSPLVAKLVNDGAYLRALIGSLSLVFPVLAGLLGIVGVLQIDGLLLPPPAVILAAIAIIGVVDAAAGFLGISIFILGAIFTAGISTAGDVRMLMGLAIIGFGPALLASAFRGLRRAPAHSANEWWERVVDLGVAPFMGGWASKGMIDAMPALAGVALEVSEQSTKVAIGVAVALAGRVVAEELVAQVFPQRLNVINPTEIPSSSNLQKSIALGLRALVFLFISSAFIGTSWHVYVGTLLFIIPSYLGLIEDKFPVVPALYPIQPRGIPGLAFSLWLATAAVALLTAMLGATASLAQMAFVLLPLPSLVMSILGLLGREPAEGYVDVLKRPRFTWVYRIGGIFVLLLTLRLAGLV